MAMKFLAKSELRDGAHYAGECRNASVAAWDDTHQCFWYRRTKFGSSYEEAINHPEDDDGFDLFYPEREYARLLPEDQIDVPAIRKGHAALLRARAKRSGEQAQRLHCAALDDALTIRILKERVKELEKLTGGAT